MLCVQLTVCSLLCVSHCVQLTVCSLLCAAYCVCLTVCFAASLCVCRAVAPLQASLPAHHRPSRVHQTPMHCCSLPSPLCGYPAPMYTGPGSMTARQARDNATGLCRNCAGLYKQLCCAMCCLCNCGVVWCGVLISELAHAFISVLQVVGCQRAMPNPNPNPNPNGAAGGWVPESNACKMAKWGAARGAVHLSEKVLHSHSPYGALYSHCCALPLRSHCTVFSLTML